MTAQPSTQLARRHFLPQSGAFAPIQREFDRLFDQLGAGWSAFSGFELSPRMDVRETKDKVEIDLELPGMSRDEVKVSIEDDLLRISGEKKTDKTAKDEDYRVCERCYGAFSRTISLPRSADLQQVSAVMSDGVLKISVPKIASGGATAVQVRPGA
ncbi:heat-shock protein Hsp20 [Caulobacter sp. CCUG 60055]|uniref:Hsp20/alpha crystallin family protein n=1 Tax=Caulobacter sp. CCUG 60055 TaxID=2100090 RepID=UPI001FA80B3A|nr:Hsp20/alpha crystallin family protein [Caulobacter sp. CCUG 60055]MCI3179216.1 heat-shock protein Hsp20 [Caulobacter sp. CCUG 60055]